MVDHPFRIAAAATNGVYDGQLLEAGVERTILVLDVDETLGDFEFGSGEIPLAVAWAATAFTYYYDATDATTPDDGLTTLVTGNGLRYHAEDRASISLNAHLGAVTAPAGDEVLGDVYRVAAAATGAFAGQDDNLAVMTRRGWVFATPEIGLTMLNRAIGRNEQFGEGGWGAFAVAYDPGSIPPTSLQFPAGIAVEDTLNAPPGAPVTDKFWIVGDTPTGAFSGHAADIAYWNGAAWQFLDPADGWGVYHKVFGFEVFYTAGVWLGGGGSDYQDFSIPGAFTWTKPSKGNVALIEVWGAGGSGGRATSSSAGGGGGGGAFVSRIVPLASLSSSVTVTVGAGGAARTTNNTAGQAGGDSSFGTTVIAYGGGAGEGSVGTGGRGGGQGPNGTDLAGGSIPGGAGGVRGAGANSEPSPSTAGGWSIDGGGGGGGGSSVGAAGLAGGSSARGGGGGGAGTAVGGSSTYGGAGGNGGSGSSNAQAGAQPGGGGGGSVTGNSGKGGDGRVRITVW